MAHFGEQCEMEYQRTRALTLAILGHLKLYSPTQWDSLYLHFKLDLQADEIEATLRNLRDQKYIEVGKDKMVRITASGRRHFEEKLCLRGDP
jgi:DNA-binding PadR family transcriptional regulator